MSGKYRESVFPEKIQGIFVEFITPSAMSERSVKRDDRFYKLKNKSKKKVFGRNYLKTIYF